MPGDVPAVVTIVGTGGGSPTVVIALNDTARSWGLAAGGLVKVAASTLGGGGGGKDDVAQGGGTNPQAAPQALQDVERAIAERVTSG
jgi:alanyl-tRNA synthetase